ncbi:MAG: autotransporter-associated beta strand repeat-containing protein, partial [Planctomycetales bacterium]|nr:autotransporter-associated beta strand repeat-containing protein [Planctomycetales bacterium]
MSRKTNRVEVEQNLKRVVERTSIQRRRRRLLFESLEDRRMLASRVWDGGGTDNNWSTAANWQGDVAPLAGDDLIFPDSAAHKTNFNDLAAGTRFNTLQFTGSGYAITGNPIQLQGGITASNVVGVNEFDVPIRLLNSQSFVSANVAATLILGDIDTADLQGTTSFLGTSAMFLEGDGMTVVQGVISGLGSVTKLGTGTATFSGNNTYLGLTDVRQGVLVADHDSALGSPLTGDTQVQAGASLHIVGSRTIAEPLAIREGGVGFGIGSDPSELGALRSIGGANTWTGPIELAGGDNLIGVDAGGSLNITSRLAAITSSGRDLVKTGDGTLRLSGSEANLFTGTTTVLQGTLELAKSPHVDAIGGNLVIGNNIGGDDAATVRILADEQIPLLNFFDSALNTVTVLSSGRLELLDNSIEEQIGNLTLTTGATYSADVDLNQGRLVLGGSGLTVSASAQGGTSGLSPAATIVDGVLDLGTFFSGSGGGLNKNFNIGDTQIANIATDLLISANIVGNADVQLLKSGAGTMRLDGANTMSGPFVWVGGLLEAGSDSAFGTGVFSWQSDSNTLIAVGGPRTINNPISVDSNNTNFIGTQPLTFTGPVTLTGNRTFRVFDPALTVTLAGSIDESIFGSRSFAKGGRGTLVLTQPNTYSGATTVNNDGGTLVLRDNGTILHSSAVTVGIGGTLTIDNDGGANLGDRINDLTNISLNGKLVFTGASGANSREQVGQINSGSNLASSLEIQNTSGGTFTSKLVAGALGTGTNRTFHLIGTGAPLSANGANQFNLINSFGLDDGILPMGIVSGPGGAVDFITLASNTDGVALVPL